MKKLQAILFGGLIAGTLDILYAFVVYGPLTYKVSPEQVLQSVARGWIGSDAAAAGGWNTALLGLATHYGIAIVMAAVFVVAASAIPALLKRPILWGFLYGLVLYVVMNYVVTPLSAANQAHHFAANADQAMQRLQVSFGAERMAQRLKDPWQTAGTIFTHTVFVAIPIALIARHFAKSEANG